MINMIYELDKVIEMFRTADRMISEDSTLLSMSTDQIFYKLDDGSDEMRHIRWGVMTRAKMKELKSFEIQNIISFLCMIEERNLLTEYIGFILQSEHNINLLELLLTAYQQGLHNMILPFVKDCIEYESNCCIGQIDNILELIQSISDDSDKYSFVDRYASLIVNKKEEEPILEKYISNYTEALEYLVIRIGDKLYNKRRGSAEKWLDIFLNKELGHCKQIGVGFLHRSTYLDYKLFEKYFEFLELHFCNDEKLWELLIPIYARYLLNTNSNLFKVRVKRRLYSIIEDTNKKRIFIQSIGYWVQKSQDCIEIVDQLVSVSFEKDSQLLQGLDYYLKYKFENNVEETIKILYDIYNINNYKLYERFLTILPQTCSSLKTQMNDLIILWGNRVLYGTISEFSLSLDIFMNAIKLENMKCLFAQEKLNRIELINILEDILLFTFDGKRIVDLVFSIAEYVKDKDFFFKYCLDKIYVNYGGKLIENAPDYVKSKNEYQSDLAYRLIEYHESFEKRITLGYEDKDFIPLIEHQRIIQEIRLEQNKRINAQAEKNSFFASFFPSRKMKYGKRIAFVQKIGDGGLRYNVSEYENHTIQKEIPCSFINNPAEYKALKIAYLKKRGKNEAYS